MRFCEVVPFTGTGAAGRLSANRLLAQLSVRWIPVSPRSSGVSKAAQLVSNARDGDFSPCQTGFIRD